jgi:phosphoserine phosphatase
MAKRTDKATGEPAGRARRRNPAAKVPYGKKVIALVYDFDGTLSPKPMQEYTFLPKIGEDPNAFWAECSRLAHEQEADPLITYMHLMYRKAKDRGIRIDRDELVELGRDVELFEGVETWFEEIESYVEMRAETPVTVRHYLISSGLKEIIEGTRIYNRFHNVFASEYWFDAYDLPFPKRVITDTSKTQYLFRINKGVEDLRKSINSHMPEQQRPIPFENMIYFGDGDTDVPSMALMRKNGGFAVAVHPPGAQRDKCIDLLEANRIDFFAPADYRRGSDLFRRTSRLLDRIISDIQLKEEMWHLRQSVAPAG